MGEMAVAEERRTKFGSTRMRAAFAPYSANTPASSASRYCKRPSRTPMRALSTRISPPHSRPPALAQYQAPYGARVYADSFGQYAG
eukprot:48380-Rhodomonas_salina.1